MNYAHMQQSSFAVMPSNFLHFITLENQIQDTRGGTRMCCVATLIFVHGKILTNYYCIASILQILLTNLTANIKEMWWLDC